MEMRRARIEGAILPTSPRRRDQPNAAPQAGGYQAVQSAGVADGRIIDLPFFVIATRNPAGEGRLRSPSLARLLLISRPGYGDEDSELSTLDLPHRGVIPDMLGDISPLLGERAFLVAQEVVDGVQVSEEAARLCVRIVRQTRTTEGI
jgi:MoxR-like ATPase